MVSIWDYFYIVAIIHVLLCCSSELCCSRFFYQFSCSVMSNSLWPHGLQYARLPCPSPTPGACSNSCPLSQWCHPTILSSVVPFSSCLQSFPASGSSPMSQIFPSGGQNIGVSASDSVLPMNTEDWFPLDGLVWSPYSPRDSGREYIFFFLMVLVYISPRKLTQFQWKYLANI